MGSRLMAILIFLSFVVFPTYGFDALDPRGNITIKWDLMQSNSDTHTIKVTMYNYQLYRHIEPPGWKMKWMWKGNEVILNMWGAEATEQGNCSAFRNQPQLPHSCKKEPTIVDLMPGAPYNLQTANCCKGGVLTSMTQDKSKHGAGFQMTVGGSDDYFEFVMPNNSFSVGIRGYSCGWPVQVKPSTFEIDNGRRKTQALATWDVPCIYSQTLSSTSPKCCVSLSAFYNSTIVHCQTCSCGCQSLPGIGPKCVKPGGKPPLLQQKQEPHVEPQPVVWCTPHMCPIRVHWHVKESYREYWRVKIAITNLNMVKNYSEWNLVALHPNFQNITQVFSFNHRILQQYGAINDTAMFWGIKYFNEMLLQEGENGNVQTELLLQKDKGTFTFGNGWGFPRRIMFNGDECVMPSPDEYPRLPNYAVSTAVSLFTVFFSTLLLLALQ